MPKHQIMADTPFSKVTDLSIHTLLLNGPTGRKYLKSLYIASTTASVLSHIEAFNSNHAAGENTNNVYDPPSLAREVQYLHVAAGFPTKATFLKSIRNGNYIIWSLPAIHNVNRHLPESEEIQKGRMHIQCQGVRPTKSKAPHQGTSSPQA